jgi:hypothetical protein
MKTRTSIMKMIFACSFILFAAFVFTSCKKDKTTVNNTPYTLTGNGAGSQMVPSVTGNGTSTFTGTYDPATKTMNYTTNWTGLSGGATSGGFYNGASGATGTAIGSPWTMGTDSTGTSSNTGTMTLTADQATELINGNWYYTIGTAANPNGEIRGQITASR